jgi:hypothetical protein
MGNHGNGKGNAATTARLQTQTDGGGVHAPLSPRLPDAATLAREGDNNGVYGHMGEDEAAPEHATVVAHYAATLGNKPAFQAMVQSVLDHWPTSRHGFHHADADAFGTDYKTPAEKALWAVFQGYDSVSRHGEAHALQVAIQDAAKAEFGLRGTADTATPAEHAEAHQDFAAAQPGLRLVLRQMYNETQAWLADHHVHEVYLYRGSRFAPGSEPQGIDYNNRVETRTITSRPLSSWATNLYTASVYAHAWSDHADKTYRGHGITTAATVPASRIFSVEPIGFGRIGEAEVVVLGGTDQAAVKAEHSIGTIDDNVINIDALYQEFAGSGK